MLKIIRNVIQYIAVSLAIIVILFILYFKITAPEGCIVLQHYYFGNGKKLELKSDYLPYSPVIIKHLKRMPIGQDKTIRFCQKEDWRLSYALNPFHLVKKRNGFVIYQYIQFDTKGGVFTEINFHIFKLKVKDNWVHILKTTPFMLHFKYIKQ